MVLLVLAALVISSIVTIVGAVLAAWRFGTAHVWWRRDEYQKLKQLFAGMSIAKFEDVLGSPTFVQKKQVYSEGVFKGRHYWVQAIYDGQGTVALFAVTSTAPNFNPWFVTEVGTATLNKSTFSSTSSPPRKVRYFASGATANSYFFDEYFLGNPSRYKTYLLGINDVGPRNPEDALPFVSQNYRDRAFDSADVLVSEFRNKAIINSYAETSPHHDVDSILEEDYQIGANRIDIREARPPQT